MNVDDRGDTRVHGFVELGKVGVGLEFQDIGKAQNDMFIDFVNGDAVEPHGRVHELGEDIFIEGCCADLRDEGGSIGGSLPVTNVKFVDACLFALGCCGSC